MPKFTVQKSVVIQAPAEKIYASVRDFRQWPVWSPWLNAEPGCPVSYADDGRSYSWDGKIIGSGEMVVQEEKPNESIHYQLTFLKPWKSVSAVRFEFGEPDGGASTEVRWTMDGSLPFLLFWMKSMMTAFVGMDYQRGLNMLKDYIETGSVPSKLDFPGRQAFPGCDYVGKSTRCALADVGPRMEEDLKKVNAWFEQSGTAPAGKPFSIYRKWDMVRQITEYTIAIPVPASPTPASPTPASPTNVPRDLVSGHTPACETYQVQHTGPYRHLGNAWAAGIFHTRGKVFKQNKKIPPFEIYESNPCDTPEDELVTLLHFPAK